MFNFQLLFPFISVLYTGCMLLFTSYNLWITERLNVCKDEGYNAEQSLKNTPFNVCKRASH
jgi:hypothetical protein